MFLAWFEYMGIGVPFSLAIVFDKSILLISILKIDSFGKYNPWGSDFSEKTT